MSKDNPSKLRIAILSSLSSLLAIIVYFFTQSVVYLLFGFLYTKIGSLPLIGKILFSDLVSLIILYVPALVLTFLLINAINRNGKIKKITCSIVGIILIAAAVLDMILILISLFFTSPVDQAGWKIDIVHLLSGIALFLERNKS